jgi:hypothetical protein
MTTSVKDWTAVEPFRADQFEILVTGPQAIAMRGELSMRDPVAEVGPYLRKIHERAAAGGEVVIDLTALTFVNSSGLRIFLDWIAWISAEPPERQYRLALRTNRKIMWQAAALGPITMLGGDLVRTENA